jgi:hypothetical protein
MRSSITRFLRKSDLYGKVTQDKKMQKDGWLGPPLNKQCLEKIADPNAANVHVFWFLSSLPLLPPATIAVFGSYLPSISLERFCGDKKAKRRRAYAGLIFNSSILRVMN